MLLSWLQASRLNTKALARPCRGALSTCSRVRENTGAAGYMALWTLNTHTHTHNHTHKHTHTHTHTHPHTHTHRNTHTHTHTHRILTDTHLQPNIWYAHGLKH